MVVLKSGSELATMREAGRVVARTLAVGADAAAAGVRLAELDDLAAEVIASAGAKPSFLGYRPPWAPTPYPGVLCLSVNDAIVHGIPDGQVLREGDLLSVDCGAYIDGYHGDAAVTVAVGTVDEAGRRLIDTTVRALDGGHRRRAARWPDRRHLPRRARRSPGVAATGCRRARRARRRHRHARGPARAQHRPPRRGLRLEEGLVIAIEPMLIEGGGDAHRTRRDGWTVVTTDGTRAAHAEHTIAITADGPVVLTAP